MTPEKPLKSFAVVFASFTAWSIYRAVSSGQYPIVAIAGDAATIIFLGLWVLDSKYAGKFLLASSAATTFMAIAAMILKVPHYEVSIKAGVITSTLALIALGLFWKPVKEYQNYLEALKNAKDGSQSA
jgi:hypothetical protein